MPMLGASIHKMLGLRPAQQSIISYLRLRKITYSAVSGSTNHPLDGRTLPQFFDEELAGKLASYPALICLSEKPCAHGGPTSPNMGVQSHLAWDFEEFNRHIQGVARGLLSMGVNKGDRVAVIMGNTSAYATLQWACASIGAILTTLNPSYRINELISTLRLVDAQHLFLVPSVRASKYIQMLSDALPGLASSSPGNINIEALPHLRNMVVVDNDSALDASKDIDGVTCAVDWREVILWREDGVEQTALTKLKKSLDKHDVINLQFTSGTTGLPKAVSLTHNNLLNNGIAIGSCMKLTTQDVLCNVPPLFHCFGLVLGNLAAWTHGASIVYPSATFDPVAIINSFPITKPTALHGVPTHFLGILAEIDKRLKEDSHKQIDLGGRLRTGIAAGSSIPTEIMKKLINKMGLNELTIAYGMTETSPVSFQTMPSDPLVKRVETVGKIQPHVKAKIINTQGEVVPVNTPGELLVSGYLLQKGYWNDEKQTQSVMKKDESGELWMHTGDEAVLDEEGYLKIVGRIKDIIIRGGENLFPVQIENVLTSHPAILEGAAISVPDPKYGEVVGAWIVRDPNPPSGFSQLCGEDVKKWVSKSMNPQNAPAWVWFVGESELPNELPKTASGKIMKHVLRDWSKDLARRGKGKLSPH